MAVTTADRLGRGLGALLGDYMNEPPATADMAGPPMVPVRAISPNPLQPRKEFRPGELAELAASIEASGLLQPLLVRKAASGAGYELVAGERRLRAVKQLGWTEVPAQVRDVDDDTLLVLALVENIQRQELEPLEEAQGYGTLRDQFGFTQQQIAKAVGKSRSAVANMLRLLGLPASVRRLLDEGALSMGHARALLAVDDAVRAADLAREAVAGRWSVRETEERVRGETTGRRTRKTPAEGDGATARDLAVAAVEEAMGGHLGTRVAIRWKGKGGGTIRIDFHGARDLERVFAAMTGKDAADVVG